MTENNYVQTQDAFDFKEHALIDEDIYLTPSCQQHICTDNKATANTSISYSSFERPKSKIQARNTNQLQKKELKRHQLKKLQEHEKYTYKNSEIFQFVDLCDIDEKRNSKGVTKYFYSSTIIQSGCEQQNQLLINKNQVSESQSKPLHQCVIIDDEQDQTVLEIPKDDPEILQAQSIFNAENLNIAFNISLSYSKDISKCKQVIFNFEHYDVALKSLLQKNFEGKNKAFKSINRKSALATAREALKKQYFKGYLETNQSDYFVINQRLNQFSLALELSVKNYTFLIMTNESARVTGAELRRHCRPYSFAVIAFAYSRRQKMNSLSNTLELLPQNMQQKIMQNYQDHDGRDTTAKKKQTTAQQSEVLQVDDSEDHSQSSAVHISRLGQTVSEGGSV